MLDHNNEDTETELDEYTVIDTEKDRNKSDKNITTVIV